MREIPDMRQNRGRRVQMLRWLVSIVFFVSGRLMAQEPLGQPFPAKVLPVAGIDAGESSGSPRGNQVFSALYEAMQLRGFSAKPMLPGRSRGGLMTLSWAAENPRCVSGFVGIYPVP